MSNLPNGWCWTTIGDITSKVEVTDPKREPAKFFTYVDIGSIDNSTQTVAAPKEVLGVKAPSRARQVLRAGDTVFSTVRTYLRNIGYIDDSLDGSIGSTGFSVLRPVPGVNSRYIYYHSLTNRFVDDLSAQMRGTSYPAVVDGQVRDMEIPLAPAREQKRIVAAIEEQFSRLDAGVAALEHVLAGLERYRTATLRSAVQGRLTAEWREQNPATESAEQLIERIKTDRSITSTGSAKRSAAIDADLPDGWCWSTTGSICECIVPNRDKPKSFTGNTPWITLPDFGSEIELHSSRSGLGLSMEEINRSRAKVIPRGSVIMSCIGRFGISAVLGRDAVINQQLHAFLVPPGINARYLAYAIQTQSDYMNRIATSTTILYLNKTNCNSVPIAVPPSMEQKQIVTEIERRLSVAEQVRQQVITGLRRGELLRSATLAAAFSGKLASQDPDDEAASALLERIAAERSSSTGDKPVQRRKPRTPREKIRT